MKIVDNGTTIVFKSRDVYYQKENDGRKPNTVRHIPVNELIEFHEWKDQSFRTVRIAKADGSEGYFDRVVTDVTCVCGACGHPACLIEDTVFIISWVH